MGLCLARTPPCASQQPPCQDRRLAWPLRKDDAHQTWQASELPDPGPVATWAFTAGRLASPEWMSGSRVTSANPCHSPEQMTGTRGTFLGSGAPFSSVGSRDFKVPQPEGAVPIHQSGAAGCLDLAVLDVSQSAPFAQGLVVESVSEYMYLCMSALELRAHLPNNAPKRGVTNPCYTCTMRCTLSPHTSHAPSPALYSTVRST